MSEDPETASEAIGMFPIGYVKNDYLEAVYDEKVYQKVSRIFLKKNWQKGFIGLKTLKNFMSYFTSANRKDMSSSTVAAMMTKYKEFLQAEVRTFRTV
jgi:hypothetical protein